MPNGTYGGVRGEETKVGQKTFVSRPTRFSSFFSSNFTDESEGILAYRISHGISRIFGLWPMARALYMLLLFLSRRFRRWRRFFFVGIILSHRFRRYTQIFLCGGLFRPTDFTDIRRFFFVGIILSHRFHRYTQIFLCGTFSNLRGYLHRPDRSPPRKSVCNRLIRKTSE